MYIDEHVNCKKSRIEVTMNWCHQLLHYHILLFLLHCATNLFFAESVFFVNIIFFPTLTLPISYCEKKEYYSQFKKPLYFTKKLFLCKLQRIFGKLSHQDHKYQSSFILSNADVASNIITNPRPLHQHSITQ